MLLLSLVALSGWIVGPRILEQLTVLANRMPQAIESLKITLSGFGWGQHLLAGKPMPENLLPVGKDLLGGVTGIFSSALGIIASTFLILFVGIYSAVSPNLYIDSWVRMFPKPRRQRIAEVFRALGTTLRWWLVGRIASMIAVGVSTTVALWVAGIPLALTLGLIAAFLSFIPFIGPVLAGIPITLVALAEDPALVIWAVAVYLAIQLLESYLITPLIQKKVVSIPPALLITVQLLMAVLFGVIGMLMATPLVLTCIVVVQMLYIQDALGDSVRLMGDHSE
jgi:predicted PurR-regulated permease PerM